MGGSAVSELPHHFDVHGVEGLLQDLECVHIDGRVRSILEGSYWRAVWFGGACREVRQVVAEVPDEVSGFLLLMLLFSGRQSVVGAVSGVAAIVRETGAVSTYCTTARLSVGSLTLRLCDVAAARHCSLVRFSACAGKSTPKPPLWR